MLGMKVYTRDYVDDCHAKVDRDVAAFKSLPGAVPEAFESAFFNNMVLVLDYLFVNRLRTVEGKDGNAMNEVRILCNSLINNHGMMTSENVSDTMAFAGLTSIKLSPENSVLKYQPGDKINLTEAGFVRLSAAFFDALERKFL
jgi:hypothetical protein